MCGDFSCHPLFTSVQFPLIRAQTRRRARELWHQQCRGVQWLPATRLSDDAEVKGWLGPSLRGLSIPVFALGDASLPTINPLGDAGDSFSAFDPSI